MYNEYNNNSRTNGRSSQLEQHYDEHADNNIDDDDNDDDNYAKNNKRFEQNIEQQRIVLLRSRQEFEEIVEKDQVNLCCVIVTSTLCKYCGVNKLKYPKYTPYNATNGKNNDENNLVNSHNSKNRNDYINGNDNNDEEDYQQDGNDEDYDEDNDIKNNINDESGVVVQQGEERNVLSNNHFFSEIKSRLVVSPHGLPQRKRVRFFHICLCAEEETDIQPLLACDITHTLSGEPPSVELEEQLHKKAYAQLIELLTSLEVCSTPCMLFFVRGQRIRYTQAPLCLKQMHGSNNNSERGNYAVHYNTSGLIAQHDTLIASGCNYVKWKKTLHNAIVIRNEMLKAHDDAERDAARQARREAAAERKRLLKEARRAYRRRRRQEEKEEEEEENDEREGDDNDDVSENDDEEGGISTI